MAVRQNQIVLKNMLKIVYVQFAVTSNQLVSKHGTASFLDEFLQC